VSASEPGSSPSASLAASPRPAPVLRRRAASIGRRRPRRALGRPRRKPVRDHSERDPRAGVDADREPARGRLGLGHRRVGRTGRRGPGPSVHGRERNLVLRRRPLRRLLPDLRARQLLRRPDEARRRPTAPDRVSAAGGVPAACARASAPMPGRPGTARAPRAAGSVTWPRRPGRSSPSATPDRSSRPSTAGRPSSRRPTPTWPPRTGARRTSPPSAGGPRGPRRACARARPPGCASRRCPAPAGSRRPRPRR
jgi:hypothetical protein